MTLLAMICGITSHIKVICLMEQVIYAVKHQSAWRQLFCWPLAATGDVMKRSLLFIPLFGLYLARFGVMGIDKNKKTANKTNDKSKPEYLINGAASTYLPQGHGLLG